MIKHLVILSFLVAVIADYATLSGGGNCTRYQGEDCSGLVDGYPCQPISVESSKREFHETANWYFQHCE